MKPRYAFFLSGANLTSLIVNLLSWYKSGDDVSPIGFAFACGTAFIVVLLFLVGLMQEELDTRLGPPRGKCCKEA